MALRHPNALMSKEHTHTLKRYTRKKHLDRKRVAHSMRVAALDLCVFEDTSQTGLAEMAFLVGLQAGYELGIACPPPSERKGL